MASPLSKETVIHNALICFPQFDSRAKDVIRAFHNSQQVLYPNQAVKVIQSTLDHFGKEAALWAVDHLQNTFTITGWYHPDIIYPYGQVSVLRALSKTDLKTALCALRKLKFYNQGDAEVHRSCYEDLGQDASLTPEQNRALQKPIRLTDQDLLQPIQILGDRFGLEGAQAAVKEAKRHANMICFSFQEKIRGYFREKFGEKAAQDISPQLKYSFQISDLFEGDDCTIL